MIDNTETSAYLSSITVHINLAVLHKLASLVDCFFACHLYPILSQHVQHDAAVAFRMYDMDGDGFVTANDLAHTLRMLQGKALSDPQLTQIVESTIEQHDLDRDGRLSFQEFTSLLTAADTDNKLCAAF